jgi:hypothetical protein
MATIGGGLITIVTGGASMKGMAFGVVALGSTLDDAKIR